MDMMKVVMDYKWLAEEAEKLACELENLCKDGEMTELEANKKMRWFLFQTANRILTDSVDKNMPVSSWRSNK